MSRQILVLAGLVALWLAAAPTAAAHGGIAPDPVDQARRATVTIRLPGSDGEIAAIGAGFVHAGTGTIVTNAHVVEGRETIEVGLHDGRVAAARVVARDPVRDIAVLAADLPADIPGLGFAEAAPIVGDTVFAVGSPFGLGQTVTRGIVSALDRPIDVVTPFGMIQHDASLNPGGSGGPVIDETGHVIGVNTAMPDGFRRDIGIAYAIPAAVAAPAVAKLATGVSPAVRRLGVSLRALTPRLAEAVGVAAGAGVLVEAVEPGAGGAAAGLAPGDIIAGLGEVPVTELRDVAVGLDRADPALPLDAYVIRGNDRLVLALPPAPAPAATAPSEPQEPARRWIDAEALGFVLADRGGAVVVSVGEDGPAAGAGMRAGDTVLAVGRTRAESAAAVHRLIGAVLTRPVALLLADPRGATRYVVVDPWARGLDADGLGGNMRHPRSATF